MRDDGRLWAAGAVGFIGVAGWLAGRPSRGSPARAESDTRLLNLRDDLLGDLAAQLRALLEKREMTMGQLADRTGIDPRTLRRMFSGKHLNAAPLAGVLQVLRADLHLEAR